MNDADFALAAGRGSVAGTTTVTTVAAATAGTVTTVAAGHAPMPGIRVVFAMQLHRPAVGVAHHLDALDHERIAQPHLAARREAKELGRRFVHVVVALDIKRARQGDAAHPHAGVGRMIGRVDELGLAGRIVVDDEFQRLQHRKRARRGRLQVFARAVFQLPHFDVVVFARDADAGDEIPKRRRGESAPTQTADGRHARVVPAVDRAAIDQLRQNTLGHHGVVQVQSGEFDLARARRRT